MPLYRSIFPTLASAQAAAVPAVSRVLDTLRYAASLAGASSTTATPTASTFVVSVDPLSAGSVPADREEQALVQWRIGTPGGATELVSSTMPLAQAPLAKASAFARVTATVPAQVEITSRLAKAVRISTSGAPWAVLAGSMQAQLQDPSTGKRYRASESAPPGADGINLTVPAADIEIYAKDTTQRTETTFGQVVKFVTGVDITIPTNLQVNTTVVEMEAPFIPKGTVLLTGASRPYVTLSDFQFPQGIRNAFGKLTAEVQIRALNKNDNVHVPVGTTLATLGIATPRGIEPTAIVTYSSFAAVPSNSELTYQPIFSTSTLKLLVVDDVEIGDGGANDIIVRLFSGDQTPPIVGTVATFVNPITNVQATAEVVQILDSSLLGYWAATLRMRLINPSIARLTACNAKVVRVTATGAWLIVAATTALEDQVHSPAKQYGVARNYPVNAINGQLSVTSYILPIVEDDPTDTSATEFGSPLTFPFPATGVFDQAQVIEFAPGSVNAATVLTASDGRTFKPTADVTLPTGIQGISGTLSANVPVRATAPGETSASVGDVFTIASSGALLPEAPLVKAASFTVPAGTRFQRGESFYASIADVTIGDGLSNVVALIAEKAGSTATLAQDDILTVLSPPTGVAPLATVIIDPPPVPGGANVPFQSQLIGDELSVSSSVRPLQDGRWALDVFTVPLGT